MLVRVGQNGFSAIVFHKLDDFSFPVVLCTFPGNNAPIKMSYNVFSYQILRFARICSVKDDFVARAEVFFHHVKYRRYLADCLIRSCENIFQLHRHLLFKFGWFSCKQVPIALHLIE